MKFISIRSGAFTSLIALIFTSSLASSPVRADLKPEVDVALLKELVETNSGTRNIAGVRAVQKRVETELVKLGFSVSYIENPSLTEKSAPLLVGVLLGKQKERFITLVTHADTVFEPESGFLHFSETDGEFRGPGVGDDKGGVVIALAGLKAVLAQEKMPPISLRFLMAGSEEVSSVGFEAVFKKMGEESVMALGFENAMSDGGIVEGRKGIAKYSIKIMGKEAHAGTSHGRGVNACVELGFKIAELSKLTDYRKGVTVNVGTISGGSGKYNIVCGSAEAKVEVRFRDSASQKKLKTRIEQIINRSYVHSAMDQVPAVSEFKMEGEKNPFSMNEKSKPFIEQYRKILSRMEGRKIESRVVGGVADLNYMSNPKLIAIDDLGAVGGNAHTPEEYINRKSLELRAQAFAEFLPWAFEKLGSKNRTPYPVSPE